MKVRVHELAKKYELKNKEFLEILKKDIGITVTSHLSNLDEDQVKKIDDYFPEEIVKLASRELCLSNKIYDSTKQPKNRVIFVGQEHIGKDIAIEFSPLEQK